MYMSGARTGNRVGITAWIAAAAGAAIAARPLATTIRQATLASISACASSSPSNMLGIPLYHLLPDASQMEKLYHFLRLHKIVDVRKVLPNNISSIALQKRALDDFLKKNE